MSGAYSTVRRPTATWTRRPTIWPPKRSLKSVTAFSWRRMKHLRCWPQIPKGMACRVKTSGTDSLASLPNYRLREDPRLLSPPRERSGDPSCRPCFAQSSGRAAPRRPQISSVKTTAGAPPLKFKGGPCLCRGTTCRAPSWLLCSGDFTLPSSLPSGAAASQISPARLPRAESKGQDWEPRQKIPSAVGAPPRSRHSASSSLASLCSSETASPSSAPYSATSVSIT